MKKQATKTILSSAVSIALSAALIAGSTFALFTSKSDTEIAITSGKVDLSASAKITKVFSAKWNGKDYEDEDLYKVEGYDKGTDAYNFSNGGTASYAEKTLTLNNISPGDGVEFEITAENNSTIAIKYQTVVTFVSGGPTNADGTVSEENDTSLYHALEISVGDTSSTYEKMKDVSSDRSTAVSGWSEQTSASKIGPIKVSIKFPMVDDTLDYDELQNQSCKIALSLYAVQANGNDTTNQEAYLITKDSNLNDVLDEAQSGDALVLGENLTMPDDGLKIEGNKELNVDLSGNTFGVSKDEGDSGEDLVITEGSSLTVTNSSAKDSKFTVDTNKNSGNNPSDREPSTHNADDKKYTMKVEGELNFEDVDVEVNNKQGDIGVCVDGGEVNFKEGTELSINGREATDGYGETGFGKGFYVTNDGNITLTNANVTSEGAVTSFLVGGETAGTLNINGGTYTFNNMYNSIVHSTFVSAFQTYENGTININGAELNLTGKALNSRVGNLGGPETGETGYTNMVLISTIGGGNVNVTNSTMTVAPELGNAIVVQTVCSYYYQEGSVNPETCDYQYHRGVQNNSHVTIGEGTKIYLNNAAHESTSGGEVCYAFAASRNGKQITQYSTDGETYKDETTSKAAIHAMEEASESYTIEVAASAKIYVNYIDGTKENPGPYYEMTDKANGIDSEGMTHTVYIYDLKLSEFLNRYDPSGIKFD